MKYLTILLALLLISCANAPDLYKFNYIDQAASAGFSYQRQLEGDVFVCVDEDKAQAWTSDLSAEIDYIIPFDCVAFSPLSMNAVTKQL